MARKKRKVPRLIVSKNAFSRFLEKNYGYTDVHQFTGTGKFSSRLNSVFLAKDAEWNDVFIKACRYGDMSENEYRCGLELWKQSPARFAKPLAYLSGKRFSFCSSKYVPGKDLKTILESGEPVSDELRAHLVESLYEIFQVLVRTNMGTVILRSRICCCTMVAWFLLIANFPQNGIPRRRFLSLILL